MRRALCAAVLLAALPANTAAQTAALSGRVIDDAGQPIAAARVSVFSRGAGTARSATTDESGQYALANLPSGIYTLTAERAGHEPRRYGQTAPSGPGTPITLRDAERQVADVVLVRYGAISGAVADEHGASFPGIVRASRFVDFGGVRALRPAALAEADRFGRYRLAELPPGEYIVTLEARTATADVQDVQPMTPDFIAQALAAVENPAAPLPEDRESMGLASYATTYYPGVPSQRSAVPVVVEPGRERAGIDLRRMLLRTTRVEGRVLNADGTPAAHTMVALVGLGNETSRGLLGASGRDGRFSIGTVPHGSYLLTSGSASTAVAATGTLVRGITLTLPADLTVSGHVVYPAPPSPDRRLVVRLIPGGDAAVQGVPPPGRSLSVGPDGRFQGALSPGTYRAAVAAGRLPPGWTVESVRAGDHDLLDLPLTITESRSDLVVTLVDRQAEISGVLRHPDGRPESGVLLIAFSADRRYWARDSRRVRAVRPDPVGNYTFEGLPPGDYLVAAVTEFDTRGGIGPDVLEPLVTAGTPVTLARGDRQRLDFTVGGGT